MNFWGLKSGGSVLGKISRNSLSLYLAFGVRKFCVLFLAIAIARHLAAAGFGLYCLALVLLELGIRLAVFGTDILIIKDISSSRPAADRLIDNALSWRIAAAMLIFPLLVILAGVISDSLLLPRIIALMGTGMIAQIIGDLYLSVVQGRERVDLYAFAQGATSVFGLALGLGALKLGLGLSGVALAYSLRGLFNLLLGVIICRFRGGKVRLRVEPRFILKILKRAAPIGASRILTIVYLGSGLAILEYFRGADSVGKFAGSMKIFEVGGALGMLTMIAAFPTISRLRADSREELKRTTRALVRFLCWLGIPLSVVIALNAGRLLSIFGPEFINYATALIILMIAIPFSLNSELVERLAYAADDQKRVFAVRSAGIFLNFIILLFLVNRLDYLAPAFGILGAEVAMFSLFLPRWGKYVPSLKFWRIALVPAVICLIALIPILFFRETLGSYNWTLFIALFLVLASGKRVINCRSTR